MDDISRFLDLLGPSGRVGLISMAVALASAVGALALGWKKGDGAGKHGFLRILQGAAIVAALASFLVAYGVMTAARTQVIECMASKRVDAVGRCSSDSATYLMEPWLYESLVGVPPSLSKSRSNAGVVAALDRQISVLCAMAVVGLVVALGVLVSAYRRPEASIVGLRSRHAVRMAVLMVAPLISAMVGTLAIFGRFYHKRESVLARFEEFKHTMYDCWAGRCPAGTSTFDGEKELYEILAQSVHGFHYAEMTVTALALALAIAMSYMLHKTPAIRRGGSPAAVGSFSLLLLIAIVLFAFGRGQMAGGLETVGPSEKWGRAFPFPGEPPALDACSETTVPLTVVFASPVSPKTEGSVWIMASRLEDPADLGEYLGTMKRNWEILHPPPGPGGENVAVYIPGTDSTKGFRLPGLSKDAKAPAVDTLGIVADIDTPMGRILPWLRAAVASIDVKRIQVVSQRHLEVKVASLGNLRRLRFCGASLRVEPNGMHLEEAAIWGDVTRAFAQGGGRVRIDP